MKTRLSCVAVGLLAASVGASASDVPKDLHLLSAVETAQLICGKKVSSEAVVSYWLARIQAHPELNAFISVDATQALNEARNADARLAEGEPCLPLGGVPIAIKDNIQVIGFANTAGTPALADFHPQTNAPIIDKLQAAGAIVVGKTNMHELAFGATGYNTAFHLPNVIGVRNAFDLSHIAGGSSSGSAAALGARLIPIAMGTDTGGSTREPCALNGCVGFRPTVGRYSGVGITPISTSRDTAGPMANSVGDIVLLDSILSGASARQAVAPQTIRLGLPDFFWAGLDADVAAQAQAAVKQLRDAGVQIVSVNMPDLETLTSTVATPIAIMEARSALTDYLKVQDTGVSFDALVSKISSPDVQGIFSAMVVPGRVPGPDATLVPGAKAYADAINHGVPALAALYQKTFKDHRLDALLFPTVPQVAIKTGPDASTAQNFGRIIRNTDPGSNVKMPGLSIPVGLGKASGLPVGMEIDGLPGTDAQLLAIGRTLEAIWGPGPIPAIAR
ncbi:indoleacetamide hydrolase [Pseudomonas sp. FP2335]|uniref:indoleacetamide hydrolase n=1 Tax=Pseudomonas sp. FP2335 TaxID=2954092 RepID=UPI0027351A49|nr:indoleacetamide hydrolase [Pseudomonas sp. FP2335]WLH81748.1 indoleacetamide hydrolase [Pseudomonas sp. FP2335]